MKSDSFGSLVTNLNTWPKAKSVWTFYFINNIFSKTGCQSILNRFFYFYSKNDHGVFINKCFILKLLLAQKTVAKYNVIKSMWARNWFHTLRNKGLLLKNVLLSLSMLKNNSSFHWFWPSSTLTGMHFYFLWHLS